MRSNEMKIKGTWRGKPEVKRREKRETQSCSVGGRAAARWREQRSVYRRRKILHSNSEGGDTLRGNTRALDISRHHCISRNLLVLAIGPDEIQDAFPRGSAGRIKYIKTDSLRDSQVQH